MTDGMSPSQFQILREDIAAMRSEWNQRFDNLVTRETFTDERRRVDGRFLDLAREISENKQSIAQEAQARVQSEQSNLQRQLTEKNEREKVKRQTTWQWLALAITLIVGPVLGALIGAAMYAAGVGGGP